MYVCIRVCVYMYMCPFVIVCEQDVHEKKEKIEERENKGKKKQKLTHTDKQTDRRRDRQTQIIHLYEIQD